MANSKISGLTGATTPLAGTETLPIVQSGATVKVPTNDLTVRNIRAAATTGILQVSGPTAGTTRTATVPDANWTAARTDAAQSFTGDQTLNTGNLVQGTAAKGINFTANTPAAGMTSQLLNWYEEGTWTPNQGSGLTVVGAFSSTGKYTRIGRKVTLSGTLSGTTSIAAAANNALCSNSPITNPGIGLGLTMIGTGAVGDQCYMGGTSIYAIGALSASSTIYFNNTFFL